MRKITFITLMMILGMSSLSFGNEKMYLCFPTSRTTFLDDNTYVSNINKDKLKGIDEKWLVKTEGNNRKMISVKPFGEKGIICVVGDKLMRGGEVTSGTGESILGGNYLTCRQPHTFLNGGYTNIEFILNTKKNEFTSYTMNLEYIYNDEDIQGGKGGMIVSGKCEKI